MISIAFRPPEQKYTLKPLHNLKEEIRQELTRLEREKQLTVLFACESGSRAWGFPSPDSDYDVRMIYIRPVEWYLSIDERKDTIVLPMNAQQIDLSGWDVRKALRLLRRSNAALFEWLHSPIIYSYNESFLEPFRLLESSFFSPRPIVHYYMGMAQNARSATDSGGQILLKKYFYVLRPLLAARWVIARGTIPPVTFQELIQLLEPEKDIKQIVEELLQKKKQSSESVSVTVIPYLERFIQEEMNRCREAVQQLPAKVVDTEPLDRLFRDLLQGE